MKAPLLLILATFPLSTAGAQTVIDFEGPPTGPTSGLDYLNLGVRFGGPAGVQEYNYGGSMTEITTSGDWYSALEMTFVDPSDPTIDATTSLVSMQNRWAEDRWTASSYDLAGNLLETQVLDGVGWLTLSIGAIHRVVLDDVNSTAFAMDNLTFDPPGGGGGAFCFGDGSGTPCPCGNSGAPGNGCRNGSFAGGANLAPTGTDGLIITAGTPNQFVLFFQGDVALNGGSGIPFGDGLRCAGVNVIRLQTLQMDNAGSATLPSISGSGGGGPGKFYQAWYRDPQLSPCGTGFNLTNGWAIP